MKRFLVASAAHFALLIPFATASTEPPLKFGAGLQAWALNDTTASSPAKSNFRLRRMELKASGSVLERTRWFVMIDPAKNMTAGSKVLQDLGLGFSLLPELEFVIGQFKTPTSAEGLDPSMELPLPERSIAGRAYGDVREQGAMLVYKKGAWKASAMVFNGQGTNNDDVTNAKDLAARVEAAPCESLQLGAFTQAGDFRYDRKARFGANARARRGILAGRLEAIRGRDAGVDGHGGAADLFVTLGPRWEAVFRYELFRSLGTTASLPTAGANYRLKGHSSKIQAAITALDDAEGANGTYRFAPGKSGTLLILSFQASI